ncbi:geranylgeranyl transferase type-2 subunit alpha isoform X2 [Ixodes scapularis]|uniref:geranylgeranyl transferase type-2 subunit alpha isoform X2 n=1 Tax=Ixodes scapularis TaxID=6945 RepID=UPI001A9DDEDD|nr:geranylgeranyl transferase type-2 subunit alpha isoform X2 [Ixodes scapularis]
MHGRLKVKTTAEQEEEKRKEREKKLKIYKAASRQIIDKRRSGELDDELLRITGQVLQSNPDDSTLWNIRREVFEKYFDKGSKHTAEDGEDELTLTELALQKNPKSYGAWSHRAWAMGAFPNMDWDRELRLCNLLLEQDERNFHGWDYRRLVCQHAKVTLEKELSFTMDKIAANFSNYSAWHYRSSLLPKVHPGSREGTVKEDVLLEEYSLVQNATFTDPGDQSGWFYHRWLTGREKPALDFLLLYISKGTRTVTLHLTQQIRIQEVELTVRMNGVLLSFVWHAPNTLLCSPLWYADIPGDALVGDCDSEWKATVRSRDGTEAHADLSVKASEQEARFTGNIPRNHLFSCELSAARTSVLEKELEVCQALHELEPQNKWPLLTCVLLMRALDGSRFQEEIEKFLLELTTVDPMRSAYYHDLRSKFAMEIALEGLDANLVCVSLAGKKLTCVHHADHLALVRDVDLSRNRIRSLRPLCFLRSVVRLNLCGNRVLTCLGLEELPHLEWLSLEDNEISSLDGLVPLKTCRKLTTLLLKGNPVCKYEKYLSSFLPQVKIFDNSSA